jgi:hypothetical protein
MQSWARAKAFPVNGSAWAMMASRPTMFKRRDGGKRAAVDGPLRLPHSEPSPDE